MMIDIQEVKDANARRGHHFFEPGTMRFFRSRCPLTAYFGPGGTYFVTSEQFVDSRGVRAPRRYTVRQQMPDGSVDTVGPFNKYGRSGAHGLALRCSLFGVAGAL